MKKIICIFLMMAGMFSSCGGSNSLSTSNNPDPNNSSGDTTVTYLSTEDEFANPERGFYTEMVCNLTDPLSESQLKELRLNKKSLVQLVYYMKDNRNSALSDNAITKLNNDFDKVRTAGMKAIVRFAYTDAPTEADAPMDIIMQHLDQLENLLTTNKDIIACVQAGFIGAWGEWYYSTNHLNNSTSYRELLNKWLEILPKDRCIQVRTPKYKQDFLGSSTPITETEAYNGQPIARIAHHDDAFMADENDMGTYSDITDKDYLSQEGLYLPIGGETCLPNDNATPSDGATAVAELSKLHWSFLNDAYDLRVLNNWGKGGYMPEIKNKLGYRIILTKGDYSTKHVAGSDLAVKISLQNIGYSAMYNPRDIELILRSADGATEYVANLPDDPRQWKPQKSVIIDEKIALPKDILAGSYKLFLFLPDPEKSIHDRPEYAVRMANTNMWEEKTGYNNLGITITISASGDLPQSTSDIKFIKK